VRRDYIAVPGASLDGRGNTKVKNAAEAIAHYCSLHPIAFSVVGLIELRQLPLRDNTPPELRMEIELLHDQNDSRLRLSFEDVKQLIIRQPSLSLFQIGLIDIRSIGEWQWENINYKVNSEDDDISFLCRSFEASLETSRSPADS
jgi:hypothetical protein